MKCRHQDALNRDASAAAPQGREPKSVASVYGMLRDASAWDRVRHRIRLRGSDGHVDRYEILLRPKHLGMRLSSLGVVQRYDVGRRLVVDLCPAGIVDRIVG